MENETNRAQKKQFIKKIKPIVILLVLIVISLIIRSFIDKNKDELLSENVSETFAVYDGSNVIYGTGRIFYFNYYIKGETYELEVSSLKHPLKKGDTVLIEYSLDDPSVARINDFVFK